MNPTLAIALFFMFMLLRKQEDDDELPGLGTTPNPVPPIPPAAEPTVVPVPVAVPQPVAVPVATPVTPAWPQAVPAGLPPFPGAGWTPDEPPGAGVVARANALLPSLWRSGAGTFKTEQTAGRWITYRATPMGSKKGVVAYRLTAPPQHPPAPAPTPAPAPKPTPAPASPPLSASAPAPAPATVPASTSPSPVAMPTLRRGDGMGARASLRPSVEVLQRRLGITADGLFGSGTDAAVRAYQRSHGLTVDGIVGRQTWTSLFGQA